VGTVLVGSVGTVLVGSVGLVGTVVVVLVGFVGKVLVGSVGTVSVVVSSHGFDEHKIPGWNEQNPSIFLQVIESIASRQ
jgi:hypothetical protein